MSTPGYTVETNGDVALSAATAKTILNYINATAGVGRLVELGISFDGTAASAEPVTVELCGSTQAGAGTSTSHTMAQIRGATRTIQGSGTRTYTAEPTTLTVWKRWLVPPFGGTFVIQFPLGREPEQVTGGDGMALRVTAPAVVNCAGYLEIEE